MQEKYGDEVCIRDRVLYTLRRKLCDRQYRVYLAPMGAGEIGAAFGRILEDAASYGKRVRFITLTERYAKALEQAFPGRFEIEEDRDLAEYIYTTQSMSTFAGSKLAKRRAEIHTFRHKFGDRTQIERIRREHFPQLWEFEEKWLRMSEEDHDMQALRKEARMIRLQLDNYEKLHLDGILIRIDGEIKGFCYGAKLSDDYFDIMIEKGDRNVPHIYKVIRLESTKWCAMDGTYVNMEEDVGVPGLRAIKQAYKPEFLIRKYRAKERE